MKGLGANIRKARGTLSQGTVAQQLGIDRTTLAHYEIDRREPDLETLSKIADLAGVSLDWLAGRHSGVTSLQQAQTYNNSQWQAIIGIAIQHQIEPEKVRNLLLAALDLR